MADTTRANRLPAQPSVHGKAKSVAATFALAVCVGFLLAPWAGTAVPLLSPAPPDAFTSFIASNRVALLEKIRSSGVVHEGQQWDDQGDPMVALASQSQKEPPPVALVLLIRAALQDKPKGTRLRDPLVIACLVAALQAQNPTLRQIALQDLKSSAAPSSLTSHAKQMVQSWECIHDYDLVWLVVAADRVVGAAFVNTLQQKTNARIPLEIHARAGDSAAERELIEDFLQETNAFTKGELAERLGYVATSNALLTIVQEFRSPLVVDTPSCAYSLRYKILLGLRDAYPDAPLFNEDLSRLKSAITDIQKPSAVEKMSKGYFDEVEKWCETNFDVQWKEPRPTFPLYQLHIFSERRR